MVWMVCGSGFLGSAFNAKVDTIALEPNFHRSLRYSHLASSQDLNQQFEFFKQFKPTIFLNASGSSNVSDSLHQKSHFELGPVMSVEAHFNILRKLQSPPTYIYISSGAVYGETSRSGADEYAVLNPISPYGVGKVNAEHYLEKVAADYGIPVIILRIFSSYSETLRSRLPYSIVNKFQNSRNAVFDGTGNEYRDFIHTDDIIAATQQIAEFSTGISFSKWNIGSGVALSVSNIVEIASKVFNESYDGLKYSYDFNNVTRPADPINLIADISKLNSISFEPKHDPNDGLASYFRQFSHDN